MPKSLVWLALMGLTFLFLMMSYRLITQHFFEPAIGATPLGKIIWMGLRFDLRYVAAVLIPLVFISLFPSLHLFKSHAGKLISAVILALAGLILFVIYGLDIASLVAFNTHLKPSLIKDLLQKTDAAGVLAQQAPWAIILLLAGIGTWLFVLFARGSYRIIAKQRTTDNKVLRLFWQILSLVLLTIAIYGRIPPGALNLETANKLGNKQAAAAALNPFENLRGSAK